MGTDLGALLHHANRQLPVIFRAQLTETYGRSQSGRTTADDNQIKLHGFSFHGLRPPEYNAASSRGTKTPSAVN